MTADRELCFWRACFLLGAGDEDDDEDAALMERLGAGLYTLQRCALIAATLWACGDLGVRRRLLSLLHQRGCTLGVLRSVLLEYRSSLGAEGGEEAQQIEDVTHLLAELGYSEAGEEKAAAGAAAAGVAAEEAGGDKRHRGEDDVEAAGRASRQRIG